MIWPYGRYDRRKHKRFNVNLNTNYAVTKTRKDIEGKGLIKNISSEGLSLDICNKVSRRAHFVVEITVENWGVNVTVMGRTTWVKRHNDTASYGIKINWLSDKEAYTNYLKILEVANAIY